MKSPKWSDTKSSLQIGNIVYFRKVENELSHANCAVVMHIAQLNPTEEVQNVMSWSRVREEMFVSCMITHG